MMPSWMMKLRDASKHKKKISSSACSPPPSDCVRRNEDPSLISKILRARVSRFSTEKSANELPPLSKTHILSSSSSSSILSSLSTSSSSSKCSTSTEETTEKAAQNLTGSAQQSDCLFTDCIKLDDQLDFWDRGSSSMSRCSSDLSKQAARFMVTTPDRNDFLCKQDGVGAKDFTRSSNRTESSSSCGSDDRTGNWLKCGCLKEVDSEAGQQQLQGANAYAVASAVEVTAASANSSNEHVIPGEVDGFEEQEEEDELVSSKDDCKEASALMTACDSHAESTTNSPVRKFSTRRRSRNGRSSLSAVLPADLQGLVGDSIALVKMSSNPYEDFRESMYQMIMEKDIEESMDVEELLYCYMSLNSPEHHKLIKEVFSDVWSSVLMNLR